MASALLLSVSLAVAAAAPPASASQANLSITLTPEGDRETIAAVQVDQTFTGIAARAGTALFVVPVRVTTVMGQVYKDGDVIATDAAGALPLVVSEQPPDPTVPVQMRFFTPKRDSRGPITLRYRADVVPASLPRKPGPSYELRGTDGGFGGAFFSFLLLPKDAPASYDLELHWNLDALPAGAQAVTTRGAGDLSVRIPAHEISTMFLLAGKMGSHAPQGSLFHAYWIGQPPFDPKSNSEWTAKSFQALQTLFKEPDTRPFYLLMRPHTLPRDGGGATRGGFMLEYGVGPMTDAVRRFMFTHEMVHHFVWGFEGDSTGTSAWFSEGLAEFYKVRLPLRTGLADLDSIANEIGTMTHAYYTNPAVSLSNAEVAAQRWANSAAQRVPYNRGFMYFADLNAKLLAASAGTESLDDLIDAMLASRRAGLGYDETLWRKLLRAKLGSSGVDDLERMLAGRRIVPMSEAFGPCLERSERTIARPTLGFQENALLVAPRTVANLDPESAAAKAGLRDGDEIVSFTGARPRIAHSASNVELDSTMLLEIRRAGRRERITFSTEGPRVQEFFWKMRPVEAGAACAF